MTKIYPLLTIAILVLFAIAGGCAHDGNCNNIPQRPSPSPSPGATGAGVVTSPSPSPTTGAVSTLGQKPSDPALDPAIVNGPKVQVFKNSGEQQCGMSPGVSLEEMKSSLIKKKIPVIEAKTQPDGLMHMALCGAPSGKIHIFKIPKNMLKKAEKLGFKVWVNKAR